MKWLKLEYQKLGKLRQRSSTMLIYQFHFISFKHLQSQEIL